MNFLTAQQARGNARNNLLIHDEVNDIESAILQAIDINQLETTITTSFMTSYPTGLPYFQSWQNLSFDRTLNDQMDTVIKYFSDLGYVISRLTNDNTGNTFLWSIKW